jgi:hypothetical protein
VPTEHDAAFWREMLAHWDAYWRAPVAGPALLDNAFYAALNTCPIPAQLRLEVWQHMLDLPQVQRELSAALAVPVTEVYSTLLARPENEWCNQIRLDINRTFATHRLFLQEIG